MSPFSTCVRCTLWCSACTVAAAWAKVAFLTSGRTATYDSKRPRACARQPSGLQSRAWAAWPPQCSPGASLSEALPKALSSPRSLSPPPGTAPYLDFELQCVGGNCAVAVESASADAVRDEILETYRIPSPASPELCAEQ